jgi:hypothetical protein
MGKLADALRRLILTEFSRDTSDITNKINGAVHESTNSGGTAIRFDKPRTYGYPTAETGNISVDYADFIPGICQLIIHNSGVEPTLGAGLVLIGGSYTISVANYIMLQAVAEGVILVTISQAS